MKLKTFFLFAALLLAVSTGLYFVQDSIITALRGTYTFYYEVFNIYVFHLSITLFVFLFVYLISKINPAYVRYAFMSTIILKLFAALIFLWPLIHMANVPKIPDICSFFAPYFIFLALEVLLTIRVLRLSYGR